MCIECNCFGTVSPYGIAGRDMKSPPAPANPELYNKPIIRIGETMHGMYPTDDSDGM
jgi:hypothetical protein